MLALAVAATPILARGHALAVPAAAVLPAQWTVHLAATPAGRQLLATRAGSAAGQAGAVSTGRSAPGDEGSRRLRALAALGLQAAGIPRSRTSLAQIQRPVPDACYAGCYVSIPRFTHRASNGTKFPRATFPPRFQPGGPGDSALTEAGADWVSGDIDSSARSNTLGSRLASLPQPSAASDRLAAQATARDAVRLR